MKIIINFLPPPPPFFAGINGKSRVKIMKFLWEREGAVHSWKAVRNTFIVVVVIVV